MIAPEHKVGLLPRYMTRIRNIITAAAGKETVVGRGFGFRVTPRRNIIGSKHMMTSTADPPGPPPSSITKHPHALQSSSVEQVKGQFGSAVDGQVYEPVKMASS